jgi:hypothetical protein
MRQRSTLPYRLRSQPVLLALFGLASWLAVVVACAPPPAPPSAPTVAVVATQVSAIRGGDATPSSTAQAVATRLAPTLQVVQQTVGPIATSVARSPVHISGVTVTADDTTVVVQNSSSAEVNLQGWSLLLGRNIALTLPEIRLAPGQTRTVHLAAGTSTDSDVFLNTPSIGGVAITFAPGQRAVLVSPDDQVASVFGTG